MLRLKPARRVVYPQTLISLLDMYDDAVRLGSPRAAAIEGEFRAYQLVLLMGSDGRTKGNTSQFVTSLQVQHRFPPGFVASTFKLVLSEMGGVRSCWPSRITMQPSKQDM